MGSLWPGAVLCGVMAPLSGIQETEHPLSCRKGVDSVHCPPSAGQGGGVADSGAFPAGLAAVWTGWGRTVTLGPRCSVWTLPHSYKLTCPLPQPGVFPQPGLQR